MLIKPACISVTVRFLIYFSMSVFSEVLETIFLILLSQNNAFISYLYLLHMCYFSCYIFSFGLLFILTAFRLINFYT